LFELGPEIKVKVEDAFLTSRDRIGVDGEDRHDGCGRRRGRAEEASSHKRSGCT
jgi:hypothetical protein